jgi:hypothetical protein
VECLHETHYVGEDRLLQNLLLLKDARLHLLFLYLLLGEALYGIEIGAILNVLD